MLYSGPARLRSVEPLISLIEELAVTVARELRKRSRSKPIRRGATLRPGVDTPHWLALAELVRPHLRKRGAKTLLARELGLHPSRVTQFFRKGAAMPDAERTLLLMIWLVKQARGVAS